MAFPDEYWMQRALELARQGAAAGEVPVGAVVVRDDVCIGEGSNQPIASCDPTAHAEVVALRAAAQRLGNYRLPGSTLYVTIEPCTMCVGTLVHARISRLVFGALEPRAGAVCSAFSLLGSDNAHNHHIEWTAGVLEQDCGELMTAFFQSRRKPAGQV